VVAEYLNPHTNTHIVYSFASHHTSRFIDAIVAALPRPSDGDRWCAWRASVVNDHDPKQHQGQTTISRSIVCSGQLDVQLREDAAGMRLMV
jgi:hypothetical protein